jgi:hypothetical protein
MAPLAEKDRQVKSIPLLLKCPGIHNATTVVTAVVEEGLIELLMDTGGRDDWFDEGWFYGHLKDRLYDSVGNITYAAHGEELWDFMLDPEGGFIRLSAQIEELITSFHRHNEDKINAMYNGYEIKTIKVIRAFRNQWLLMAEGVKL